MTDKHVSVSLMNTSVTYVVNGGLSPPNCPSVLIRATILNASLTVIILMKLLMRN